MNEIQKKISGQITLPLGYSINYGGAYKEQQRSFSELLIILIIASLFGFLRNISPF